MLTWWLTPLSGAELHTIAPWAFWHARLMVLGWGLLLPVGVLVARFAKVLPAQGWPARLDNPLWWHGHRGLQWAGVLCMTLAAWLAWGHGAGASAAARLHSVAGWCLVVLGWLQVASSWLRGSKGGPTDVQLRGDHYDMTPRRRAFERWHKALGWCAVLAAVLVMLLGLWLADAPRWMPLILWVWWVVLAVAFVRLQKAGCCIDTYQAIWGPDPAHPGNRVPPTGWGVRRPLV